MALVAFMRAMRGSNCGIVAPGRIKSGQSDLVRGSRRNPSPPKRGMPMHSNRRMAFLGSRSRMPGDTSRVLRLKILGQPAARIRCIVMSRRSIASRQAARRQVRLHALPRFFRRRSKACTSLGQAWQTRQGQGAGRSGHSSDNCPRDEGRKAGVESASASVR